MWVIPTWGSQNTQLKRILIMLQTSKPQRLLSLLSELLSQVYRKFSRVKVRFKERTENVKDEVT